MFCSGYEVDGNSRGPFWWASGRLYWAETHFCEFGGGGIVVDSVPSETRQFRALEDSQVDALVLGGDERNVYAAMLFSLDHPSWLLFALPLDGSPAIELATTPRPDFFLSDGTTLFWHADGQFFSLPANGGSPRTLATAASVSSMAVTDGQVLWTDAEGVHLADGSGSGTTSVASDQAHPRNLHVAAAGLYWTTDDAIVSLPLGASEPITLAGDLTTPLGFDVDADSLYWTDSSAFLKKRGIEGGAVETLAHLFGPKQIFVTPTSVVADEWCTTDQPCGAPGIAEVTPK